MKASCYVISGCTVSKPGLILSEAGIRSCSHCYKLCMWMLALISIVHPVIAIHSQMTKLSTNLTHRPIWSNPTRTRLTLLEMIERMKLWRLTTETSTTSTSSIVKISSASSSIVVLIKTITIRLLISWCSQGKNRIFNLYTFIEKLFFCI